VEGPCSSLTLRFFGSRRRVQQTKAFVDMLQPLHGQQVNVDQVLETRSCCPRSFYDMSQFTDNCSSEVVTFRNPYAMATLPSKMDSKQLQV
jgi:hypothetical protein